MDEVNLALCATATVSSDRGSRLASPDREREGQVPDFRESCQLEFEVLEIQTVLIRLEMWPQVNN